MCVHSAYVNVLQYCLYAVSAGVVAVEHQNGAKQVTSYYQVQHSDIFTPVTDPTSGYAEGVHRCVKMDKSGGLFC